MRNLTNFNISGNHLPNALKVIETLGSLITTSDVSSNSIGMINAHTFEKFDNLKYLNLSRTNISNFGFQTFFHQRKLETLDISYNQLKVVDFTLLLRNFINLKTLNLEGNDLTEVKTLTNVYFPNLMNLGISRNRFSCDYLVKFLLQWPHLHIIYNPSDQMHIDGVDCIHLEKIEVQSEISNKNEVTNSHKGRQNEAESTGNKYFKGNSSMNNNWFHNSSLIMKKISETTPKSFILEPNFNYDKMTMNKENSYRSRANDMHSAEITPTHVLDELRAVKYMLFILCLTCCGYMIMKSKLIQQVKRRMIANSRERNVIFRHDSQASQHVINLIEN